MALNRERILDEAAKLFRERGLSELRDAPSRPPVVWALPIYSTFLRFMVMVDSR